MRRSEEVETAALSNPPMTGVNAGAKAWWGGAVLALAALAWPMTPARAASIAWDANGGTGGDWADADNWNGNVLPDSTLEAQIFTATTAANPAYIASDVGTIGQVNIGSGQFVEVRTGGAISTPGQTEDSFRVNGTLTQLDGTITITSNALSIGSTTNGATSTYTISGGTLNTNRFFVAKSSSNSNATFNQTGGTVNDGYGGSDSAGLRLAAEQSTSVVHLNFSGGTFNGANGVQAGKSGSATLTFSGAAKVQFTNGNDFHLYSGNDSLVLDGSRTGDGTNVSIHGALKLSETSDGSTLGALIDAAAVGDNSLMRQINVSNRVEFDHATLLDPDFAVGVTPTPGTWTLLTWTGTDPNPANLSLAPGVDAGWSYNLDTTANTLAVTYVPEPATLTLLGVGAVGVLMRRRRSA